MHERQDVRIERDSMGEVSVPSSAYYGAQTQRAVENFTVSGLRFQRRFIQALGLVKKAAAQVNARLGLLPESIAGAVVEAADEVARGELDEHFVVDIFQTGSGTSTNMNANEVIANRAIEILGGRIGSKDPVHPNDHVNRCQSSNDVIPTATHVAGALALSEDVLPALEKLEKALAAKAEEFAGVIKIGRTHLQDATPVYLGQTFGGYARQIALGRRRVQSAIAALAELAIGGTAVGTGLNAHPDFAAGVVDELNKAVNLPEGVSFVEAADHFEAQAARDAVVEASGALRVVAVSLSKIANDLRLLGSGPRCGIGEIRLPDLQPGSSIMPGKVNPVVPESVIQVAAQVIGSDLIIAQCGQGGIFELNVMQPLMAYHLLLACELLANASHMLADRCVSGIEADRERCESLVEHSLAMVTSLAPIIGYDAAAEVAKEAYASGRTVREVAREKGVLSEAELEKALDPRRMTAPGV